MNPTVLGGAASLLLLVLCWSGRRRPRQLLRSTDAAAIAALNRGQIAALRRPSGPALQAAGSESPGPSCQPMRFPPPGEAVPPAVLLRRLAAAMTQEPAIRLAALRHARAWGHRSTVPLLLRGLRDSDPAVVREAVLALERFRGRPAPATGADQAFAVSLPRNVALTR